MTADQMLAITRPEQLYPGDVHLAKAEYERLSQRWQGEHAVTAHVITMYRKALETVEKGEWPGPGMAVFDLADGSELALSFRATRSFPMGRMLISDHLVTYLYHAEHRHYTDLWKSLEYHYANKQTRQALERHFPDSSTIYPLSDGRVGVQIPKRPDQLRLADVGPLAPEHLAWVVGNLLFLCGYLQWAGQVHLHIAPETCFMSGRGQTVALLGGWEFRTLVGAPIRLIPQCTANLLEARTFAHAKMNLDQVRATGRELLTPGVPPEWVAWLLDPDGTSSAKEAHGQWTQLVLNSGIDLKPKWTRTADEIYRHEVA